MPYRTVNHINQLNAFLKKKKKKEKKIHTRRYVKPNLTGLTVKINIKRVYHYGKRSSAFYRQRGVKS